MESECHKKVICVIPAYQEEKNVARAVRSAQDCVDEVIVVDDGSDDDTFTEAKAAGALVYRHPANRGQGAALETGRRAALRRNGGIIVHFDADNQFLANEIKDVIAPIAAGQADIVFGSRFLGKTANLPLSKRYVIIPLAHLANLVLTGHTLSDPQCGFRALARAAAEKIEIEQDSMAHCSEIIGQAFRLNLKIKEVPVTVLYHSFGQRLSGGVKIIFDLMRAKIFN